MFKRALGTCLVLVSLAVAGCGNAEKDQPCPVNDKTFFKSSIDGYYSRQDPAKVGKYAIKAGERYDTSNNWWIVPFDLEGQQYLAMISCDGHLELSLGSP